MPIDDADPLLVFALESEIDAKIYARWITGYDREMGYEEFKNRLQRPVDKPKDKIMEEVNAIIAAAAEGKLYGAF